MPWPGPLPKNWHLFQRNVLHTKDLCEKVRMAQHIKTYSSPAACIDINDVLLQLNDPFSNTKLLWKLTFCFSSHALLWPFQFLEQFVLPHSSIRPFTALVFLKHRVPWPISFTNIGNTSLPQISSSASLLVTLWTLIYWHPWLLSVLKALAQFYCHWLLKVIDPFYASVTITQTLHSLPWPIQALAVTLNFHFCYWVAGKSLFFSTIKIYSVVSLHLVKHCFQPLERTCWNSTFPFPLFYSHLQLVFQLALHIVLSWKISEIPAKYSMSVAFCGLSSLFLLGRHKFLICFPPELFTSTIEQYIPQFPCL